MTTPACARDAGYSFAAKISGHPSGSIYDPGEARGFSGKSINRLHQSIPPLMQPALLASMRSARGSAPASNVC
jgi:hypothetical protein